MHSRSRDRKILRNGSDILLLVAVFLTAVFLAKGHAGLPEKFLVLSAREWLLLFLLCMIWNFGARVAGLYDEFRIRSFAGELFVLGASVLLHSFLTIAILFAAKSQVLSRFFVFVYCSLLLGVLVLWKAVLRWMFRRYLKNGRHQSRILVVGGGRVARSFCATIDDNPHLGLRVIGYVGGKPTPEWTGDYLGTIDQLPQLLERDSVDEVVVALPNGDIAQVDRIIGMCENHPVRVRIIPDYFRYLGTRYSVSRFGLFPVITLRAHPLEGICRRLAKRSFDLLFSALLFITVFSWLWPLLALLIKASSPGPVFFKQERWGIKNKRIECYKFRSMAWDSKDVDENGRYQQARIDDPRVTRFGRFLRCNNLDELPQFINVLKGDMSIVGPRPHPTPMNLEVKDSIQHYQMRHLIKPGITGWAQVKGFRGETSDPEMLCRRIEADLWYIENWSFLLDLKIIALTGWVMLKGDPHAY